MRLRVPTFLYVGLNKAGSSWLFEILREHPDVFVPVAKDIMFFDRYFERGLDWYASFFRKADGATAVGELSNDYLHSRLAAGRIRSALPDVKLIVSLREPGDWAVSRYAWELSLGLRREIGFDEFMERPDVNRELRYAANLSAFYELFPRSNIQVLFYEDLREDAGRFARDVYEFIGVDPGFVPPSLHRRVLPSQRTRVRALGSFAYRTAQAMRSFALVNQLGALKRRPILRRMLYSGTGGRLQVPGSSLQRIRERTAPEYELLEELVGREVPPGWRLALQQRATPTDVVHA